MIPKLSAPLIKDIRTGEGVAEWALGLGVSALTACGDLSIAHGATYLTVLAGLKGIRRGLLKITALQAGVGIGAPQEPAVITHVQSDASKLLADVAPAVDPATTDAGAAA